MGAEHPEVANTLNNLAVVYSSQGRYAEAESQFKRALAIKEKAVGAEHPTLANSLVGLANVDVCLGRFDEAEPLLQAGPRDQGEGGGGPSTPKSSAPCIGPGRARPEAGDPQCGRTALARRRPHGQSARRASGRDIAASRAASTPSARSSGPRASRSTPSRSTNAPWRSSR